MHIYVKIYNVSVGIFACGVHSQADRLRLAHVSTTEGNDVSTIKGFKSRNFRDEVDIEVDLAGTGEVTTLVKLEVSLGSDISNAIHEAIELASKLGGLATNNSVEFDWSGVLVTVKADSDPALIYRDWSRGMDGCLTSVSPYPISELSEDDLANDSLIREARQRESKEAESRWIADQMAKIKYTGPPAPDQKFLYAPMYNVDLIQPDHFDHLPKGTVLTSFNGARKAKGVDYIDNDTRGGFLAYGFPTRANDKLVYEGPYRTQ
jgi:hypothetical protein